MSAYLLAVGTATPSGEWVAAPGHVARAARAIRRVLLGTAGSERGDYCLLDPEGEPLGTLSGVRARPSLGPGHPTVYVHRTF